jgi:hypothetical protein
MTFPRDKVNQSNVSLQAPQFLLPASLHKTKVSLWLVDGLPHSKTFITSSSLSYPEETRSTIIISVGK